MPAPRPPQPPTPAPDAFAIHRSAVADDMTLGYVREGVGGYPLLLVHGYPETKRIWWRNIEPLVAAKRLPMPDAVVTDIGSGGGSPAVPMKLAAPSVRLRMVESRTRRAAFLREAVRQLGLERTEVEACRYEELAARGELLEQSDVLSVRAVRTGARMLRRVHSLVKPGGVAFLFGSAREDLEAVPAPWRLEAACPLLDPDSRLVVLRKHAGG